MTKDKQPKKPMNEAQRIMESHKLRSGDNWNELINGQENRIKDVIMKTAEMMKDSVQAVSETGVGDEEFHVAVRGTARDLQEYANRVSILQRRRNGRQGPTASDEEYTEYISIGLEFAALDEEMGNVLPLGLANITEYHGRALRVKEEQEKASAQDPNVVTDVQVKESQQPAAEPTGE